MLTPPPGDIDPASEPDVGQRATVLEEALQGEELIKAMTTAHKVRDRYTILGETGLTAEAAERLARTAHVI